MVASKVADSIVKKIFSTDKRIQFCALVNSEGEIEAGGIRPGLKYLEPSKQTRLIVTRTFLNQVMSETSDRYFGRVNWALVHREKLLQITFPLKNRRQLQITASLRYPISRVPKLVRYASQLGIAE
jgi:hypothetical protein